MTGAYRSPGWISAIEAGYIIADLRPRAMRAVLPETSQYTVEWVARSGPVNSGSQYTD